VNLSPKFFRRGRDGGRDASSGEHATPATTEPGATTGAAAGATTGAASGATTGAAAGAETAATEAQGAAQGAAVAQASADEPEKPAAHTCPHCNAPMADDQEWCTQCGERSGSSMRKRAGWASAGALTAASAILASGAAAAGVAALTQGSVKETPHLPLTAQAPPTTTTTVPPARAPAPVNPGSPETLRAPHPPAPAPAPTTPASSPATPTHPTSSASSATHAGNATHTNTQETAARTESHHTTTTSQGAGSEAAELQGLTASAYTLNPEYSKSSLEGPENDPSRALEGHESGTYWTVTVKRGTAQNFNVGLLIALGGATSVGSVEVHTTTPGIPLEVFGTTRGQVPTSISSWTRLALTTGLKPSQTLKLGSTRTGWRFVLLWMPTINQSLRHVTLGEVALYAPTG
jgi:hypothetical protein